MQQALRITRRDARPAPAAGSRRPAPARAAAAAARRGLPQGASGHAIAGAVREARLQRVTATLAGGGMVPANTNAWPLLTALEKASIRRLEHDPYRRFAFASTNHLVAWAVQQENPGAFAAAAARFAPAVAGLVNGPAIAPVVTTIRSRRQQEGPAHALAGGLPPVASAAEDPLVRAYGRLGHGKFHPVPPSPRTNWVHYVEAQHVAARAALPPGHAATAFVDAAAAMAAYEARRLDAVAEHPAGGVMTPALGDQAITPALAGDLSTAHPWEYYAEYLSRSGAVAAPATTELHRELAPPTQLAFQIDQMWGLVANANAQARGMYPLVQIPHWGPVRGDGIGTWVHARFTPLSTWAAGSSSDVATAGMPWNEGRLSRRRKQNNLNARLYIQGHLLNAHIGGPALAYNMVPLAEDATGAASNANLDQYYAIEGRARNAVRDMMANHSREKRALKAGAPGSPSPWAITGVTYSVVANFGGHAYRQAATQDVALAAVTAVLMQVTLGLAGVNTAVQTVQQLRDGLAAGTWAAQGLNYIAHWTPMKDAIDAVVPVAQRGAVTTDALVTRLQQNQQLWAYENQNVPDRLHASLTIERAGSPGAPELVDRTIDNVIGTVPNQPFVP